MEQEAVSEIYMPVSGLVSEFNSKLEETPELINTDPYGDGWIIKITISDKSELNDLFSSTQYAEFLDDSEK